MKVYFVLLLAILALTDLAMSKSITKEDEELASTNNNPDMSVAASEHEKSQQTADRRFDDAVDELGIPNKASLFSQSFALRRVSPLEFNQVDRTKDGIPVYHEYYNGGGQHEQQPVEKRGGSVGFGGVYDVHGFDGGEGRHGGGPGPQAQEGGFASYDDYGDYGPGPGGPDEGGEKDYDYVGGGEGGGGGAPDYDGYDYAYPDYSGGPAGGSDYDDNPRGAPHEGGAGPLGGDYEDYGFGANSPPGSPPTGQRGQGQGHNEGSDGVDFDYAGGSFGPGPADIGGSFGVDFNF